MAHAKRMSKNFYCQNVTVGELFPLNAEGAGYSELCDWRNRARQGYGFRTGKHHEIL